MAADTATSPRLLEPVDAAQAADMLRDANQARQALVIRGHGTKANWGAPPSRVDAVLSVAALREPVDHCAGDLTVTAAAGVSLADLNAHLAREGQWLPLDPLAGGSSSVGGLLATNDSGPRRVRYGAPRDLVIGVEYILADGRRAKAGGRVVKNVAGYDLCRLLCGSFGSLALITSATFKLSPLPAASRTVSIVVDSHDAFAAVSRAIAGAAVVPSAFEIHAESSAPVPRILVRFETTAAAADAQAGQVIALAGPLGAKAELLQGSAEDNVWVRHGGVTAADSGMWLRLNVPSASVATAADWIARRGPEHGVGFRLAGRIPLGALMVRVDGEAAAIARFAAATREWTAAKAGYLAVLAAPPSVTASVAAWNDVGSAAGRVMRAVKAQFDPHGTLCPGGGPAGLA
jgi:glycolate dehydrogenase FAD-binding subunit